MQKMAVIPMEPAARATAPLLRVQALRVRYDAYDALDAIDLDVAGGYALRSAGVSWRWSRVAKRPASAAV